MSGIYDVYGTVFIRLQVLRYTHLYLKTPAALPIRERNHLIQRAHFEPMPTEDRDGHEDDNVEEEEESVQDRTKDSKKDVGVSVHPVETTDEAGPAGPSTQRP
jgi:hypothetical protein